MEEKRRLPLWMVGVPTADKPCKPLDANRDDVITKEEVNFVTTSTEPKARGRTLKHKKEVCPPGDEANFLVKCKTKRKKREFVAKDVIGSDDPGQEVVVEKRKHGRLGKKVEETDPSRKKEENNYEFESSDENQAPSHDEDDDDLTMDDMLSIAKEFVENDKRDMGQQKQLEGRCKLKSKSSYTSSSATEASPIVPQDTRSPMHEKTALNHNSMENTSKVKLADSRMTGDPAQDMLDLFLGPLLKKPIGKEEASSMATDILLPHDVKNQQHDIISNKPVSLTKKKSSLRDVVAMLLD